MGTAIYTDDVMKAEQIIAKSGIPYLVSQIASAIAEERKRCADIAMALDSGRGNEKEIAQGIMNPIWNH